jgi:hypothetical protein
MNQTLRRGIYKKKMANWENYRKQRNLVTKIKKKSIRNYFWPTIKPFLTNKGLHFNKDQILCEENKIINNQNEVAETFNIFFYKCSQRHPLSRYNYR